MSIPSPISLDTHWHGGGYIEVFLLPHKAGYVLVETGPQSTFSQLVERLKELKLLSRITHIVVTHIHLDHAGAAGALQRLTGAPIFVHPRGKKHLLDPTKLVESARNFFGESLESRWGIPEPALDVVLVEHGEKLNLKEETLEFFHTPGHAEHHLVLFSHRFRIILAGDVAGVRFGDPKTVLPPTAPPEFHPQRWLDSLALLQSLPARGIALTHGGVFLEDPSEHLRILKERLLTTVEVFSSCREAPQEKTIALWNRWLQYDPALLQRMETIMPFAGCMMGIKMGVDRKE